MGNLSSALHELCAERKQAQLQVEKLDTAISVIESLNGTGKLSQTNQPTRIISQVSRRKMAQAQRARWAKARQESQPIAPAKTTNPAPPKRTMSAAARRKIAAFQKARWAKVITYRKYEPPRSGDESPKTRDCQGTGSNENSTGFGMECSSDDRRSSR